jgi:hypothetical protein
MSIAAVALGSEARIARAPRASVLVGIALVAVIAAACSVLLALTSDHHRLRKREGAARAACWAQSSTACSGAQSRRR